MHMLTCVECTLNLFGGARDSLCCCLAKATVEQRNNDVSVIHQLGVDDGLSATDTEAWHRVDLPVAWQQNNPGGFGS